MNSIIKYSILVFSIFSFFFINHANGVIPCYIVLANINFPAELQTVRAEITSLGKLSKVHQEALTEILVHLVGDQVRLDSYLTAWKDNKRDIELGYVNEDKPLYGNIWLPIQYVAHAKSELHKRIVLQEIQREVDGTDRSNRGLEEIVAEYPNGLIEPSHLIGKDVLDVSTGGGNFVLDLRLIGAKAIGLDRTLNSEQKNHEFFVEADASQIPIPSNSFDAVFINWSYLAYSRNIRDYNAYLSEAIRLCRSSCRIFITPFPRNLLESILKTFPELSVNQSSLEKFGKKGDKQAVELVVNKNFFNPHF